VQFIACFSVSFLTAKFAAKKGPRLQLLLGYVGFFVVILLWLLVPFTNLWMIIPISIVAFFLNGYSFIMANNALQTYFLMTVPKTQQVVTAILVNVLGSCCAGLVGMLIAGSLLKLSPILEPQVFLLVQRYFPSVMKQTLIYKIYFAMLLPILFIGLYWICKIRNINASLKENLCEEKLKENIISKDND
jgi:MFS family permease